MKKNNNKFSGIIFSNDSPMFNVYMHARMNRDRGKNTTVEISRVKNPSGTGMSYQALYGMMGHGNSSGFIPRLLFVCQANLNRSPTFEKWFKKNMSVFKVRSAGIDYGYPYQVDKKLLKWADIVYVMDLKQLEHLYNHFPEYKYKYELVGISDQYDPDDPALICLIEFWWKELMK